MKRTLKPLLIVCILIPAFWACSGSKKLPQLQNKDVALLELKDIMAGTFNSEAQSKNDTSYFNISLIMTPIWEGRTDGQWLYVEQAVAGNLASPYRQRVYRLRHPQTNIFTSDIYTIKNALSFAGAQTDTAKMNQLLFETIELKDGCTVTLTKNGTTYQGGTDSAKCPSELRGATYATTKITLKTRELISWDQGFNAANVQVWGATKGGYIFVKQGD